MYFDEVYHARTATEFLQDWQYGEPHAIYEFTHPHLAKYAMAWGIEVCGDHRVTRPEPSSAPQWSMRPSSLAGRARRTPAGGR